tara:strand:+ start:343 stop:648 length:306 start_codon:yes stop_codon:yes gene_type:complete
MPKKFFVNRVCDEFCSLLLSKPLILLDIGQLKKLVDTCRAAYAGCCSRGRAQRVAAEKISYSTLSSLSEKERKELKKEFLDAKKHVGIKIMFPETNKELIL